jgi:hypothetical protein
MSAIWMHTTEQVLRQWTIMFLLLSCYLFLGVPLLYHVLLFVDLLWFAGFLFYPTIPSVICWNHKVMYYRLLTKSLAIYFYIYILFLAVSCCCQPNILSVVCGTIRLHLIDVVDSPLCHLLSVPAGHCTISVWLLSLSVFTGNWIHSIQSSIVSHLSIWYRIVDHLL